MRGAPRWAVVVALCCLSITAVVAGVGVVAGGSVGQASPGSVAAAPVDGGQPATDGATVRQATLGTDRPSIQSDARPQVSTVVVAQEFERLPDRPGVVRVTRRFEIPENVRALRTTLPEQASVTATSGGFEQVGDRRWEWTGGSRTPAITHDYTVNQTGDVAGPEGTDGRFLFADVGEWGIVRRPGTPTSVEYVGSAIRFDEPASTVGPGVAGDRIVFLGEHDAVTKQVDGQRLRLVVPAAADLAERRSAILSSVADASTALRVGQRDDEVLMIAAPTSVNWAVRGLQTGESDFWVAADEPLEAADNTWLHEYVHTRQDFNLTSETRWVSEATATYYAALLSLEQDLTTFEQFRRFLATGAVSRYDSVVLAEPSTWRDGANYRKGGLVTGELDRQLRVASESSSDFQAVFRQLNERRSPTDAADFVTMVHRVGTDEVASEADRYVTTSAGPEIWGAVAHGEAFGQVPPRIHVALPDDHDGQGYRVEGPYRNRSLGERPFVLVPGERLSFAVRLSNDGGATGEYNLSYGVAGGEVRSRTGTLDPGESTLVSVAVTVQETGQQRVRVGEHSIPVSVAEPATPTVDAIRANDTSPDRGDTVELAIDFANDADRPGERTVTVRRDATNVTRQTVRLDAGESETISVPVRLPESGPVRLSAGEESITVQVGGGIADAIGPGLGPVGAVVAVIAALATAVGWRRARRRR